LGGGVSRVFGHAMLENSRDDYKETEEGKLNEKTNDDDFFSELHEFFVNSHQATAYREDIVD
jgi:hypothetical protein